MRVSRTLPNVPVVVASSCASVRCVHASSKRRFAQRLYVKKSGSPVVIALISFYNLFSNNASRKRWGRKRGWREQIIACTEGREPALRDRTKDGIPRPRMWWMGNISDALAADPCLIPVCCALLHTDSPPSCCLLSHPPSLFGKTRRSVAQDS